MRINYRKIVTKGFLNEYLKYCDDSETPIEYDFWCGIWLLSSVLGRQIKVNRPNAPVYLNWYILLLADSGVTRKSSAIKRAREILYQLVATNEIISTCITPEALEQKLHDLSVEKQHSHLRICISELITLLGKSSYSMKMPGLLTDLYDCPEIRAGGGTLTRGELICKEVYCSLLSASTPAWLSGSINPSVVEGGFTSRTIFVVNNERKKKIAWSNNSNSDHEVIACLNIIKQESKLVNGEVSITNKALNVFTNWYNTKATSTDTYCNSFESREDSHVLRLAACLSISSGTWTINVSDIKNAIRIISKAKVDGSSIFEGNFINDKLLIGLDKLRETLYNSGKETMTQTDLYKKVGYYYTSSELASVLLILHELKMVQRFINKPKRGRGVTSWRGTTLLMDGDALNITIKKLNKIKR